jgi:ElaB/YqjD/DUF883 family membrane-anchored ribosome-binding protein
MKAAALLNESLRGKASGTFRRAEHLSRRTRRLRASAADALDQATHRARRALKRGSRGFAEYRDDAVHQIRRQPVRALGAAASVGVLVGACLGRMTRQRQH